MLHDKILVFRLKIRVDIQKIYFSLFIINVLTKYLGIIIEDLLPGSSFIDVGSPKNNSVIHKLVMGDRIQNKSNFNTF